MKEKYDITGMTCSACSAHVEKAVKKLEGMKNVSVNLLQNSMTVEYDESILNSQNIIDAIVDAGKHRRKERQRHEKATYQLFVLFSSPYVCFNGAYAGRTIAADFKSGV